MKNHPNFSFFLILVVGTLFALFQTHGIILSDEGEYAHHAFNLAGGTFKNTGHHFENRFGLLLPMVMSIKIFGSKYWVFFVWTFFCFLGILSINFFAFKKYNFQLALYSSLLIAINPTFSWLALDIAPDLVMTFLVWAAILGLWFFRQSVDSQFFKGGSIAFLMVFAFSAKMTVIALVPFLGIMFIADFLQKKHLKFWISMTLGVFLFGGIYFGLYAYFFEDPFLRFSGVSESYAQNAADPFSFVGKDWKTKLFRISILPIGYFMKTISYGILVVLGVWFAIKQLFYSRKIDSIQSYFSVYLLSVLGYYLFGTFSPIEYVPITFADRMILPVLPGAIVCTYFLIESWGKGENTLKWLLVLFSLVAFIGLIYFGIERISFIGMVIIGAILVYLIHAQKFKQYGLFCLIGYFLFGQLIQRFENQSQFSYSNERTFLQSLDSKKNTLIVGDHLLKKMNQVFFDFEKPDNIQFCDWETIPENLNDFNQFFILQNQSRKHFRPYPDLTHLDSKKHEFSSAESLILEVNLEEISELNLE